MNYSHQGRTIDFDEQTDFYIDLLSGKLQIWNTYTRHNINISGSATAVYTPTFTLKSGSSLRT